MVARALQLHYGVSAKKIYEPQDIYKAETGERTKRTEEKSYYCKAYGITH